MIATASLGFLFADGCRLLQQLHLAINAQHFGHLLRKLRVALLQVVAHLVRLHLLLVEDLAHRALGQVGEAGVPLRRSMLACVAGKKPRRPQFVRIAKFLRLPACQRRQPCLGFDRDRRLLDQGEGDRPAPPAGLRPQPAQHSAGPSDDAIRAPGPLQKTRGPSGIPAKSAPARPGSPVPFATAISTSISPSPHSPSDNSIARRHAAITINPLLQRPHATYREPETTDESPDYDNFHGIGRLVGILTQVTAITRGELESFFGRLQAETLQD